jgi:hypothetical protein
MLSADQLNKIHNKQSYNAKSIDNSKKIIVVFSPFAELPQFPGKNTYSGHKQNYKKCKKLYPKKHLFKPSFYQTGKIDNQQQNQKIKKVASLEKKGRDCPALMQLMWFEIGIRYRKNNDDESNPKYIFENISKICHLKTF